MTESVGRVKLGLLIFVKKITISLVPERITLPKSSPKVEIMLALMRSEKVLINYAHCLLPADTRILWT